MLWLKAFHIVFVVTWFAGLFYLPRLFVNGTAGSTNSPP
jgi:putative membrane protein